MTTSASLLIGFVVGCLVYAFLLWADEIENAKRKLPMSLFLAWSVGFLLFHVLLL